MWKGCVLCTQVTPVSPAPLPRDPVAAASHPVLLHTPCFTWAIDGEFLRVSPLEETSFPRFPVEVQKKKKINK